MSNTLNSKPTIIIVGGAWHGPLHYASLSSALARHGYDTVCERNPSCDPHEPSIQSVQKDSVAIRDNLLLPLIDNGQDVIMVMHSYGGMEGSGAAQGQSKKDRTAKGLKGGVVGLVYIAAFVLGEGVRVSDVVPKSDDDLARIENEVRYFLNPKDIFYNDVPPPLDAIAISALKGQADRALTSPNAPQAWSEEGYTGKLSYLHTTLDVILPFAHQKAMLEVTGKEWTTREYVTGHCPFVKHPELVADFIAEQIGSTVEV